MRKIKVNPRLPLQWGTVESRYKRVSGLSKENATSRFITEAFKRDGARYAAQDACGALYHMKRGEPLLKEGRAEFWFILCQARLLHFIEGDGGFTAVFSIRGGNEVAWTLDKGDGRAAVFAGMRLSPLIPAEMKEKIQGLGRGGDKYAYGCLWMDGKGKGDIEWHIELYPGMNSNAASAKEKLIGVVKGMPEEEAAALLEHIKKGRAPSPLPAPPAKGKTSARPDASTCSQSLFPLL